MSFDIESVLNEMASVISNSVKDETGDIKSYAKDILNSEKVTLKELSKARFRNEIDEEVFNQEVEREKKVIEAELLTLNIMTKVLAQKAISPAIDVFVNAVKSEI